MKKRLHTDLPLPKVVGWRKYLKAYRKKHAADMPICDCRRLDENGKLLRKTARNMGCVLCNKAQEVYEFDQQTREQFRKRRASKYAKYFDWQLSFLGNGGYHHKVPATSL